METISGIGCKLQHFKQVYTQQIGLPPFDRQHDSRELCSGIINIQNH
jgi:hypothetical protein